MALQAQVDISEPWHAEPSPPSVHSRCVLEHGSLNSGALASTNEARRHKYSSSGVGAPRGWNRVLDSAADEGGTVREPRQRGTLALPSVLPCGNLRGLAVRSLRRGCGGHPGSRLAGSRATAFVKLTRHPHPARLKGHWRLLACGSAMRLGATSSSVESRRSAARLGDRENAERH